MACVVQVAEWLGAAPLQLGPEDAGGREIRAQEPGARTSSPGIGGHCRDGQWAEGSLHTHVVAQGAPLAEAGVGAGLVSLGLRIGHS